MKYLLAIMFSIVLFSCSQKPCKHNIPNSIVLVKTDSNDHRPVYTVIFEDDKTEDYMYAEEIAYGLTTGIWRSDEDLKIAYDSEYQLWLEPDSLLIWDGDRKVAAIPYNQIGVLDSLFRKENE